VASGVHTASIVCTLLGDARRLGPRIGLRVCDFCKIRRRRGCQGADLGRADARSEVLGRARSVNGVSGFEGIAVRHCKHTMFSEASMLRVRMRGMRKWTSKYDERSRAPGADGVVGNVMDGGGCRGSVLEQLFALLRNGCSADCERFGLLISPRQPNKRSTANNGPSMVGLRTLNARQATGKQKHALYLPAK
jgi:hypothetical protein